VNTAQAKLYAWTLTAVLGTGLAGYVGHFVLRVKPKIWKPMDEKRVQETLDKVPAQVEAVQQIVPFKDVDKALIKANWTGKVKPVESVEVVPVESTPQSNVQPVESLVSVVWIQCDGEAPEESRVVLRYKDSARVSEPKVVAAGGVTLKRQGEKLDPPLEHVHVKEIQPIKVLFAFSDEGRPAEELVPGELGLGLGINLLPEGSQVPNYSGPRAWIETRGTYQDPQTTQLVRPNWWQVGTEDAAYFEQNYSDVLANDVRMERHRDSKGRYDGIEIKEVKPGSIAANHGAKAGDVIKSINGHPVTSQQEAISFVKNNKDKYDVWVVEVWNKGQTKTYTYKAPQKK
jgi:hypothetical protein